MVNFPLVSRALSFFPLSTPIKLIFPAWLPVAINLESGENATVHVSTKTNLTLTIIKCNIITHHFNSILLFISRLSLIIRVNVVLNRTVVVDSD